MSAIPHEILNRVRDCKIVPVITLSDVDHALPLADALMAGGVDFLEVTLRTSSALACIEKMASSGVDAMVGAGTITRPEDVTAAKNAGARFLVSPGATPALIPELQAFDGPVFPGVASVSEAMIMRDHGFTVQKFFPAEPAGGPGFLKSIAGPMPDIRFIPTGGISQANAPGYLELENVIAVGGSWIVPNALIAEKDWAGITKLCLDARQRLESVA
ncbi:MAG: keto-deoxy-phosphogluconate aldolase [Ponticaulis sp.]|nr:keto-deoxy-phosphogluconate aldolase [Ponticaulis sp.]|tara:strand:+ start:17694 stop:18341 length:648 start_codon:yes stop_codon:yes gene_type:complete